MIAVEREEERARIEAVVDVDASFLIAVDDIEIDVLVEDVASSKAEVAVAEAVVFGVAEAFARGREAVSL